MARVAARKKRPGSGQKGLDLRHRVAPYVSMVRYVNAHNQDFAREHWTFFTQLRGYVGELQNRRVVDVGCGASAPGNAQGRGGVPGVRCAARE
jgi:hypothetical protein